MGKERQWSMTLDGIRADHISRYLFACDKIPGGSYVLDIACGCGYGSYMMERAGLKVTGVDISEEAINHAKRHYEGPTYYCQKAEDTKGSWDAIVSFETLEHLANPEIVLQAVKAPLLIASVPNEEVMPFVSSHFKMDEYPHQRHYTPDQFEGFLNSCGFEVLEKHAQRGKTGPVEPGTGGMFLVYVASR